MQAERTPLRLTRLSRAAHMEPRYSHPNGWTICRDTREWNAYGVLGGQGGTVIEPKVMWLIYRANTTPRRMIESFSTLRAARAWCDRHEWDYAARRPAPIDSAQSEGQDA